MNSKNKYYFLILPLVVLLSLLIGTQAPQIDSATILGPLIKVNNLSDYIHLFRSSEVYDIQPIRDLFHLFDLLLFKLTNISRVGVLSNIILFIFLYFLITKFFSIERFSTPKLLGLLFIGHPAIFIIFTEETSKKHILSLIFFLISYILFNKFMHDNFKHYKWYFISLCSFLFSLLSHPISIFLPIYLLVQRKISIRYIYNLLPFFLIALIIGLINYYYYLYSYTESSGNLKFNDSYNIGEIISYIGLYLYKFIIPFNFPLFYKSVGVAELIFSLGTFVSIYISFKKLSVHNFLKIWIPFLCIIFILYHKNLDNKYLNTYFLFGSLSFFTLSFYILTTFKSLSKKYLLIIYCLFLMINSYNVYLRSNPLEFYKNSYAYEPSCANLNSLLSFYVKNTNYKGEFLALSKTWLNQECQIRNKSFNYINLMILTNMLYLDDKIPYSKKVELVKDKIKNTNELNLVLSALAMKYNIKQNFYFLDNSLFRDSILYKELKDYCLENKCTKKGSPKAP